MLVDTIGVSHLIIYVCLLIWKQVERYTTEPSKTLSYRQGICLPGGGASWQTGCIMHYLASLFANFLTWHWPGGGSPEEALKSYLSDMADFTVTSYLGRFSAFRPSWDLKTPIPGVWFVFKSAGMIIFSMFPAFFSCLIILSMWTYFCLCGRLFPSLDSKFLKDGQGPVWLISAATGAEHRTRQSLNNHCSKRNTFKCKSRRHCEGEIRLSYELTYREDRIRDRMRCSL